MNRQTASKTSHWGARSFLLSTTVLGAVTIGLSVWVSAQEFDPRWLYLLALTLLGSCFPVRMPFLRMPAHSWTVTVADVFIFAGVLVFGPAVAVILAAAEGVDSSIRVRVRTFGKALFNVAQLALAAFVAGQVFLFLQSGPLRGATNPLVDFWFTLAMVGIVAACYFLSNSALVAAAQHLSSGQPLLAIWRRNFACTMPAFLVNGSAAAVIFVLIRNADLFLGGVLVSAILISYFALALWFMRRADSLRAS